MSIALPRVSFVIVPLLVWSTTALPALAQVRMNLRNGVQIDGLETGASMDERFWPVECNAFAPGDLDGDGDLDLLVAVNRAESRVYLNDGHGAFLTYVSLSARPQGAAQCALFDADGDGDLDALIVGGTTTYPRPTPSGLFLNNGLGAFVLASTLPSDPTNDLIEAGSVAVGDVDGDGDRDVVVSKTFGSDGVRLWRNQGSGAFVDASAAVSPPLFAGRTTLVDVDTDGDLDIVRAPGSGGLTCDVRLNSGVGSFSAGPSITYDVRPANRAVGDVDGDGLVDEVGIRDDLGMTVADVPYLLRNLGGGQFQDVSTTWFEPGARVDRTAGFAYHACALFDADGDGDLDMVTGGNEGRGTTSTTIGVPPRVFLNTNRQRFVHASRTAMPMETYYCNSVAAGDIDGDGDVDLVQATVPDAILRQDAAGNFAPAPVPSGLSFGTDRTKVLKLVDVEGDGDLDLVVVFGSNQWLPWTGSHRLMLNDGQGNFTDVTAAQMPTTAVSAGASCDVGDVDGDGDVDIVIGSNAPSSGGPGDGSSCCGTMVQAWFADAAAQVPTTLCARAAGWP